MLVSMLEFVGVPDAVTDTPFLFCSPVFLCHSPTTSFLHHITSSKTHEGSPPHFFRTANHAVSQAIVKLLPALELRDVNDCQMTL